MDREAHDRAAELLGLWEKIADSEKRLGEVETERQKIFQAQKQIQGNMGALSHTGQEGALRARYVEQLASSEERLKALDQREADLKADIEQLKQQVQELIEGLA